MGLQQVSYFVKSHVEKYIDFAIQYYSNFKLNFYLNVIFIYINILDCYYPLCYVSDGHTLSVWRYLTYQFVIEKYLSNLWIQLSSSILYQVGESLLCIM